LQMTGLFVSSKCGNRSFAIATNAKQPADVRA